MNIHIVNILLQNIQTNILWKKVLVWKNCSILGGSPNSARLYKKCIERSIVHFFLYQTKVQVESNRVTSSALHYSILVWNKFCPLGKRDSQLVALMSAGTNAWRMHGMLTIYCFMQNPCPSWCTWYKSYVKNWHKWVCAWTGPKRNSWEPVPTVFLSLSASMVKHWMYWPPMLRPNIWVASTQVTCRNVGTLVSNASSQTNTSPSSCAWGCLIQSSPLRFSSASSLCHWHNPSWPVWTLYKDKCCDQWWVGFALQMRIGVTLWRECATK